MTKQARKMKKLHVIPAVSKPVAVATKAAPKRVKHPLLDPFSLPDTILMRTLYKALSMRRAHGSTTEAEFVGWLCNRLPASMIDAAGNIHVDLRYDSRNRTLFTAHTDTVHHGGGVNTIQLDGDFWRADGAPLGADDGAGVALMCHMIERKVGGYYIFFRGEECGGIGSSWLAENAPILLAEFDRAVAFDRAGYSDVITHQSGGRCCSDKFAEALSDQLNDAGMLFMPCKGGVYTDTAEFTGIVAECTNLSVGYKNQHGDREEQDVKFLVTLATALESVQWDTLPTERDPKAKSAPKAFGSYYTTAGTTDRDGLGGTGSYDVDTGKWNAYDGWPEEVEPLTIDDMDHEELELYDAVMDALFGRMGPLVKLLAAAYSYEYAAEAETHLRMHKLTDAVLTEAKTDLEYGECALFVTDTLLEVCAVI